jgi:hypothetical protein
LKEAIDRVMGIRPPLLIGPVDYRELHYNLLCLLLWDFPVLNGGDSSPIYMLLPTLLPSLPQNPQLL